MLLLASLEVVSRVPLTVSVTELAAFLEKVGQLGIK